jgi:hypothetical protein
MREAAEEDFVIGHHDFLFQIQGAAHVVFAEKHRAKADASPGCAVAFAGPKSLLAQVA